MSDTAESAARQQQEAARFRSSVSEALLQSMQGNINYLLSSILPVGSVVASLLTESQFQDIAGTGWILADNRSISSSTLATVTGITTAPDLRGVFVRGKNNGRSTTTGNAAGDLALGAGQSDTFASHTHSYSYQIPSASPGGSDGGTDNDVGLTTINNNTGSSGSTTETKPRNVTLNYFIRID